MINFRQDIIRRQLGINMTHTDVWHVKERVIILLAKEGKL